MIITTDLYDVEIEINFDDMQEAIDDYIDNMTKRDAIKLLERKFGNMIFENTLSDTFVITSNLINKDKAEKFINSL